MPQTFTPLEDATLRYVLGHAHEADGWLDLTRISTTRRRRTRSDGSASWFPG
ncbi:MAG: hypothetical protein ACYTG6_13310 [Planctomycetota bacterium]|jgi:hypothetical protein